jgi:hypothetical protein
MHRGLTDGKTRKQPKLRVVKEEKMATEKEAEERAGDAWARERGDGRVTRQCLNERGPPQKPGPKSRVYRCRRAP